MAVICDTATVGLIYRIGTLGSRDRGGHARRHPSGDLAARVATSVAHPIQRRAKSTP